MSQQLATRAAIVDYRDNPSFAVKPFPFLPQPAQQPAFRLWKAISHVPEMQSAVGLCLAIVEHLKHGLHADDLPEILERMTHPWHTSRFKFATDVTTTLGRLVQEAIDRRESQETLRRYSQESTDSDRAAVSAMMEQFMRKVG